MGSALMDVIFGVIRGKSGGLMDGDQISVELAVGISLFIIEDFVLERANTPFRTWDREWE